MAYKVDAHLINPAILRALTNAARVLTAAELSQLRSELVQDPQKVGYSVAATAASASPGLELEAENGPETQAPAPTAGRTELKGAHEITALLNTSGRAEALFGPVILEAADVMLAVSTSG